MGTKVKKKFSLQAAWNKRLELHAEADKLRAEGSKLYAEGDVIFAEAVLAVHGNIEIEWQDWDHCILETGEVFGLGKDGEE